MKVQPIYNYQPPEIPSIQQAPKEFALKFIPKRWLKNAVVAGALCSFLSVGCGEKKVEPTPAPESPETPVQTSVAEAPTDSKQEIKFYNVAPIFSYSVTSDKRALLTPSAIVYQSLTEEDARRIIIEEAKKYGLNFTTEGEMPTISGIDLAKNNDNKNNPQSDSQNSEDTENSHIFVFDGVDKDKRIAFEVVTTQDLDKKTKNFTRYDPKAYIHELREVILKKQGDYTVGIFYDPETTRYPKEFANDNVGESLLRAQVQEFILWLAQNNLIELGKK